MKSILKKGIILGALVFGILSFLPKDAKSQIEVYCWGCRDFDICDHVPVSEMCCWDNRNGGTFSPCPRPQRE